MKRILTALILLLCLSSIFAVNLDVMATSGDFNLYDAYGRRVEADALSDLEGLIVITDKNVTFSTAYGDITLAGDSIFSILSLSEGNPTFYLIDGKARFDLKSEIDIDIYTPVTLTRIDDKGSYQIVSSDSDEAIFSLSSGTTALALNALDGRTYEIKGKTYTSLTKKMLNTPLSLSTERDILRPLTTKGFRDGSSPKKPVIYVKNSTLPPVPSMPTLSVSYNIPEMADVTVTEQETDVPPSTPSIRVIDVKTSAPSKPEIINVQYMKGLIPPTVTVFEAEKKTLTE